MPPEAPGAMATRRLRREEITTEMLDVATGAEAARQG